MVCGNFDGKVNNLENKSDDEVILRQKNDSAYETTSSGEVSPDCAVVEQDGGDVILKKKVKSDGGTGLVRSVSANNAARWPYTKESYSDGSSKSPVSGSGSSGRSSSSGGTSSVTFLRRSLSNIWRKSFNRGKRLTQIASSNSSVFNSSCSSASDRSDVKDFTQIIGEESQQIAECNEVRANALLHRSNTDSSGLNKRSANSICVGIRSAPSSPMAPLQGQSDTHGQSVVSLNTISRSPSHHNATKLDSKSLKLRSSPASSTSRVRNEIPEKKRKELSSSREKKFHRHFQQVSKEERLINYFSCALVSDFLLQGHLYITKNYFAFYSNVFGFVTKLLIPTASVIKISKEKTAKIIPNAVGVTTAEERHVFGSFMSRETAFRLMCSVCPPLEPTENIQKVPDVEVSEECSVEDDSSCSISGNESPPQVIDCSPEIPCQRIRTRPIIHNNNNIAPDVVDSPKEIGVTKNLNPPKPLIQTTPAVTWTKSPPPRIVPSTRCKLNPVYLAAVLMVILSIFTFYLYVKISEMESMMSYKKPDYKIDPDNDLDVYAESFKRQKEMELKSAQEIQSLINSHFELIAMLQKSLENLSLLMHQHNILFDTMKERSSPDRTTSPPSSSGVDEGASTVDDHMSS